MIKQTVICFLLYCGAGFSTNTTHRENELPFGTVEQFHVTVRSSLSSIHVGTITAAIIRITFPNHPKIFLNPSNIETSSLHGLTQLICNDDSTTGGRYQLFESIRLESPSSASHSFHGTLPRRLLPLPFKKKKSSHYDDDHHQKGNDKIDNNTRDPFANLLLQTATNFQQNHNEYAMIFPLKAIQTVVTTKNGTTKSSISQTLTMKELISKCQVRFVHPANQILSTTTSNSPIVMNNFVGDVKLTHIDHFRYNAESTKHCQAAQVYGNARKNLINRANHLSRAYGFLPTDGKTCIPMPSKIKPPSKPTHNSSKKKKSIKDVDTSSLNTEFAELFVDGEEDMANAMTAMIDLGLPQLGGVIMGPIQEPAQDFAKTAGGSMADKSEGQMEGQGSGTIEQAMTEQITGFLSRGLKSRLTETLVPPLKETVVASVTSSTTQLFQLSLTKILTKNLQKPLVDQITQITANHITKHLDSLIPEHTARLLAKELNHMLARSIPHSVVPSLVHTLTHSPLQDYYCFYCYHHKTYCQYCHYAPQQMYYASYYTGFYSTYYGDYYGDYALRQRSAEDLTKKKQKEDDK
jgi:hypothetical protein